MALVKIYSKILNKDNTQEVNCNGILNNNKLIYQEDEAKCEITFFNNYVTMKRIKADGVVLEFLFNEGIIKVSDNEKVLDIPISVEKIKIGDKSLDITYILEDDTFSFSLSYSPNE